MHPDWHRQNWSGHTTFGARRFHRPRTVEDVQAIVRSAAQVRVIGSRHCFNDIADTKGDLIWLGDFDHLAQIDRERRTVTVDAGVTYETLCPQLEKVGLALPNLPSLKHVTVVGACTTATHGSGNALGNLATAIRAVEMVKADGSLVTISRERDGDLARAVFVSLGALGVVTKVTLDLEPAYFIQQDNYERLPFAELLAHFDAITSAGESVSLFPTWRHDWVDTVWVKRRVPGLEPVAVPDCLHGARLASADPTGELPVDRTLTPFGRPGIWHERLPHYALHEPWGLGNELQSEYFVARDDAVAAIAALRGLRNMLTPVLGLSEIRTIRRDDLWLSSAYGRDTVGIHFNWLKDGPGVARVLPELEATLARFGARPHLGKLFALSGARLADVYPKWDDFSRLCRRWDPLGKFANAFVRRYVHRDTAA